MTFCCVGEREHLFVYGTLRKAVGHPMAGVLARDAGLVGRATYRGRLYDLGHYPGAVSSPDPADLVLGEVYALHHPRRTLQRLDVYEGCGPDDGPDAEYRRVQAEISLDSGQILVAWIYLYHRSPRGACRVASGDYLAYLDQRPGSRSGG